MLDFQERIVQKNRNKVHNRFFKRKRKSEKYLKYIHQYDKNKNNSINKCQTMTDNRILKLPSQYNKKSKDARHVRQLR